jgi:trk system potassium uptake protein TrkH
MRIKVTLHYLGLLIAIVGATMLLPLFFSLYYQESDTAAFAISMAITTGSGLLLWRLTPLDASGRRLSRREAIALVAGSWLAASLFGALPYFLSGALPSFLDAFFEAMSGYTTTGATVFTAIEEQCHGILLWRALTQWLGGMGIIMLFVALFPLLGIGSAHLAEAEMPGGQQGEKLTARMRDTAKALWLIYFGLTIAEFVLLRIAGMPIFDAVTVTLSTTPTGGFTPTALSIGAYNSLSIELIIIFFMVAAGVNFGLYYYLIWKRQPGKLFKNPEFKLYIVFLIGAMLLLNLDLVINAGMSLSESLRLSGFQAVSIMTTTGFATTDFNAWPEFARSLLLVLMVIGASAGSTGGALKVIRLLVLAKYTYRRILLAFNPHAVAPLKVDGGIIPEGVTSRIISLTILYFAVLVVCFLIMSALPGLDNITALSSVTASLGNVGPGLGLVGPMENYFFIPAVGKGVLIFCMLAGRLELFTLLMLFTPAFWRWR